VDEARKIIGGPRSLQVCIMNPDGSDLKVASNPKGDADYPGWSYDGSKLLFGIEGGWAIVNADGSNRHVRKENEIPTPYQSPDGKWRLYGRELVPGLFIAPIDQKKGRRLIKVPEYCCLRGNWSPDSRFVLYTAYDDAARKCMQLWRIDIESGQTFKITGKGTPSESRKVCVFPDSAKWSPDGSTILFEEDGTISDHYRLHLVDPDGANPRSLLAEDSFGDVNWDTSAFAWSPDGKAIMFGVVTDDGSGGLFVSTPDGKTMLRVDVRIPAQVADAIAWAPG
jgi:Tol biopolymer transport system component